MQFTGTSSADVFEGGVEDDAITGAGGNDRLFGGRGRDVIAGDAGNDLLSSRDIVDTYFGSPFDDGAEADTVRGGVGNDVVAGGWNDTLAGGEGIDVLYLDLRGAAAGVRMNLSPLAAGKPVGNGAGTISGFEAYGVIFGSAFADDIRLGEVRTFNLFGGGVYGGGGDDRIDAGTYGATTSNAIFAPRLDGGAGDDVVIGSAGSDTLVGGDGNDRLTLGNGADVAYGGIGDDLIDARGFGSDLLDGGAGRDTLVLSGVRSDWTTRVELSDGNSDGATDLRIILDREQPQPNGASGRSLSLIDVEAFRFEDRGATLGQVLAGIAIGTDGDDLLTPGHTGLYGTRVTAGDDLIYGSGGSDVIDGGAGADTMYGGNGGYGGDRAADTFYVRDAGDRVMDAGEGDVIFSWISYQAAPMYPDGAVALIELRGAADLDAIDTGASRINGNTGNNHLTGAGLLEGGAGDDVLESTGAAVAVYENATARVVVDLTIEGAQNTRSAGYDTLIGIRGLIGSDFDDVLRGSDGDDTITGGLGDDRLVGGGGADMASYLGSTSGVTLFLGIAGPQDTGGAGIDTLSGFEGLAGSVYDDRLTGSNRSDVLDGSLGDDVLLGGLGDDRLEGGGGDDRLNGGAGGDDLTGGDGADLFLFDTAVPNPTFPYAYDRINDFAAAEGDRIDLSGVDADTARNGDQAFRIVDAFTGSAGELVLALDLGFGPCIGGDVDGDREVDLLIYAGALPVPDTALVL